MTKPESIEEWYNVVLGLLDIINTGVLSPPDHDCSSPDALCDNLCFDYAYQCQTIAEAKKLLKQNEKLVNGATNEKRTKT